MRLLLALTGFIAAFSAAKPPAAIPALWMPFGRIGYILQRLSTYDNQKEEMQKARLSPIPAAFRSNNVPDPVNPKKLGTTTPKPRPYFPVTRGRKQPSFWIPPPMPSSATDAPLTTATTTAKPKHHNCEPGWKCHLRLRSFETDSPVFQYAYSHSTPIGPLLMQIFDSTMGTKLPLPLNWNVTMGPETAQLLMNLMRFSRPNRVLVVGVFTGLAVVAASTGINERGIVVGVEEPKYVKYWALIGQKYAQQANLMNRIQIKSDKAIPQTLEAMSIAEPGSFDMVLLDDVTLENYLVDYERCLMLLRSGGVLLINDVLASGEAMAGQRKRSSKGDIMDQLNRKLRTDPRVTVSFLPFANGFTIAVKN